MADFWILSHYFWMRNLIYFGDSGIWALSNTWAILTFNKFEHHCPKPNLQTATQKRAAQTLITKTLGDSPIAEWIERKTSQSHIKNEELKLQRLHRHVNNLHHKLQGAQKTCAQQDKEQGGYVFPRHDKCSESMWHFLESKKICSYSFFKRVRPRKSLSGGSRLSKTKCERPAATWVSVPLEERWDDSGDAGSERTDCLCQGICTFAQGQ